MSKLGRKLKVGDEATTDYGKGLTLVVITKRIEKSGSQSGICYCVKPSLRGGEKWSTYDADWFEPVGADFL